MARQGYKTRQQQAVLDYLAAREGQHVTAAQLVRYFTEAGQPIGTATVYRQLEKLEAQGLIRRYQLGGQTASCFAFAGPESACHAHFHLKCECCGELFHLQCGHLNGIQQHVQASHGFALDPGKTVFYGICATCGKGR